MLTAFTSLTCTLVALTLTLSTGTPVGRKVPCTPGDLVFVDCNLCTCNPQGMPNQMCARMWCQPPPRNHHSDNDVIVPAFDH